MVQIDPVVVVKGEVVCDFHGDVLGAKYLCLCVDVGHVISFAFEVAGKVVEDGVEVCLL